MEHKLFGTFVWGFVFILGLGDAASPCIERVEKGGVAFSSVSRHGLVWVLGKETGEVDGCDFAVSESASVLFTLWSVPGTCIIECWDARRGCACRQPRKSTHNWKGRRLGGRIRSAQSIKLFFAGEGGRHFGGSWLLWSSGNDE